MKLSPTQEKALQKMKRWYSADDLQVSLATMYALVKKGRVISRGHDKPGAVSSPRNIIEFTKIK